jgi:hypothetical protein
VTEQRYKAVLEVIAHGRTEAHVTPDWDVARQTVHVWLERYEADGLERCPGVSSISRDSCKAPGVGDSRLRKYGEVVLEILPPSRTSGTGQEK